jgi:DNA-directed RNA polymerase alpha subunit
MRTKERKMAKALDPKTYTAALEDLVVRLATLSPHDDLQVSGQRLIALASANAVARSAKQEAERLAAESEKARAEWAACKADALLKDSNPSSVLPSIAQFLEWARLSVRAANALKNSFEIRHSLLNLVLMTEQELSELRSIGRLTVGEIRNALASRGLWLGMTREEAEAGYKNPE